MQKSNARNLLDNEAFMMDIFIAIVNVMDLDTEIKDGWIEGFQNRKIANKQFVNELDDAKFDNLVSGERALLKKLIEQIPAEPKTDYEKCWLANFTRDDKILEHL